MNQSANSVASIRNYVAIDERLATSGQPSEAQLAELAREGFELVINLGLHDDPRYSLPDETGTVRSLGMDYIHIPVAFKAPKETDLMVFFDAMQVNAGRKMLVHCAANIRVAAFIGLYRIIKQGWSAHEALGLMRTVMEMQASRPKEHDVASEKIWSDFIDAMIGRLRNADSLRHGSHSKSSGQ